ncbi:MAG: mechanosensitive ion channel domain-containing protein, partial [Bacteroidota bacterium]
QKSIANLLAGFQIAFTQPIRLDDALVINGEYGWVEEITLTYVVHRLWDQRRQIVPLQKFIDDTFQNWTHTSSDLIGAVLLYLDYTFPVQELRDEVDRWLPQQTDLWDERVKSTMVTDNNAEVMTVRILVSAKNAGNTFDLRCRTREYLIGWIRDRYPQALPRTRVEVDRPG